MTKKTKSFEEALLRLEEIVNTMEEGELSLDQTVKIYREGVELAMFCGKKLSEAKGQVTELSVGLDGQLREKPFLLEEEE